MDLNPDLVFGDHLRRIRHAAGLTQRQLSEKMNEAGVTMYQSTIGKIEAGSRSVSIGEAVQLAAVLGIGLSDIIDGQVGDWLSARLRITTLRYKVSELTRQRDEAQILLDDALAKLGLATAQLSRESRQAAQNPAVSAGAPASGE